QRRSWWQRTWFRTFTFTFLLAGCWGGGDEPLAAEGPGSEWPVGTVLAVDDVPISSAEVAEVEERLRLVYPEHAASFRRRAALESLVLPRAALRVRFADARRDALAACRKARAALVAGEGPPTPEPEVHRGGFHQLQLLVWGKARSLEPGRWSEPIEGRGFFLLLRLEELSGADEGPAYEELTVSILDFPYLPADFAPTGIASVLSTVRLSIVDPEWEQWVPEDMKYRMRGGM
ncbi:MAG: hypothetical protein O7B99_01135, partial [Planctomycetota bacterium]|nr:hypothetical protein [Planctomycetota bacterium]